MKKQIQLVALLLMFLGLAFTSCKKDEPDPEPELTETERLLTTKKWRFEKIIDYGVFDVDTDTATATSDTSENLRANRYMDFDMDGNAFFKAIDVDTTTVEYLYSLNDDQSEMRIWERGSIIYPLFYIDYDMVITALDDNRFIIKGDSKRRMAEAEYPFYSIDQWEFTSF